MAKKSDTADTAGAADLDAIEAIADGAEFDAATLVGDVRDCLLDIVRNRPKPWQQMTSGEQADVARTIEYAAKTTVQKMLDTIIAAQNGITPIRAILESYAEKDGIKAQLKIRAMTDEQSEAAIVGLHKARGKIVTITVADDKDFDGEREEFEPDPDQGGLEFEAGSDEIDESAIDSGDADLGDDDDDGDDALD